MNKKLVLCFILSISIFMIYNSENKQTGGLPEYRTTHQQWLEYKNKKKSTNLKYYLQIAGVFIAICIVIYFLNVFIKIFNRKRIGVKK